MRRLAYVAIFVACSAPPSATPDASAPDASADVVEAAAPQLTDFTSGSRLRAEIRSGGDARVFRGWFDSQLGTECTFVTAEDGKLRCLPAPLGTVTYSDSACTQPARVSGQSPQTAPLYGATSDACQPRVVYAGTGEVTALQSEYVLTNGGACVFTNQASWEYPSVAHVDASMFVAGTIQTRAIDAQISVNVLVAEDGAMHIISAHDIEHGDDCDLRSAPDGTPACAPPPVPSSATCTGAPISACANAPPAAFAVYSACGWSGVLATPAGACANAPELTGFTQGAAFDLPALARIPLGDGRLHAMWTARGTTPIRATTFYDTELDVECDGVGRCVPVAVGSINPNGSYYIDATCFQPAIVDDGTTCSGVRWVPAQGAYYERAEQLAPNTPLWVGTPYSGCVPTTTTSAAYATTRVTLDQFATLTDSVE